MKEIALAGPVSRVFGDVLGALLGRGLGVNAMVPSPEKVMLNDERLTVTRLDTAEPDRLEAAFEGYHDVVMAFDDNLTNGADNELALKYFVEMVSAAARAGVARVVVVGSPQSEAFFAGNLRRRKDVDWVFISTENDYPARVADEIVSPTRHREVYRED